MATKQNATAQTAAVQQPPVAQDQSILAIIKGELSKDKVKQKFSEVLGTKAPQFMASITNVVSGSKQLKQCNAASIMSAAFVAATYDLPIDPNLGFAAIVPYNNSVWNPNTRQWDKRMEAQFQIMYKGFIQLAIRSGLYEEMSCSVVYSDELVSYNPIKSKVVFVDDFTGCTQRLEGDIVNVAGFYASFKLLTGYRQELFMTTKEVELHARKYSQSYKKDLRDNTKKSLWSTNFEAMGLKTVIKRLLSKWGALSVDVQNAIVDDQRTFSYDGSAAYGDNMIPEIPQDETFTLEAEETGPQGVEDAPKPEPKKTSKKQAQKPEPPQDDFAEFERQYAEQSMNGQYDPNFGIPDEMDTPFR